MRLITIFLSLALSSCVFSQSTFKNGVVVINGLQIGENGTMLDTSKVEGLNLNFYNDGNVYTVGIASPDTLYNITFLDVVDGGFSKNLKGSLTKSVIDRQTASNKKGFPRFRARLTFGSGTSKALVVDGVINPDNFLKELRMEISGEMHLVDSLNTDTIYIDGAWSEAGTLVYADFAWFTIKHLPNDSARYGTETYGNIPIITTHNKIRAHNRNLDNFNVVSKTGGMLWRHDNWLGYWNSSQTALASWHGVLDKYNIKATSALNEQYESRWIDDWDKYAKFWRSLQARGHEIAAHGPQHHNYRYYVEPADRVVTTDMPGVMRIGSGPVFDTVYCDTISGYGGIGSELLTNDGFDIMLKRSNKLFEHIGLNQPTYWIEGGGQAVYYNPDSLFDASWKNGYIGGGKYTNNYYQHMGFNSPWKGKSEYFMNWNSPESISLVANGNATGVRNYSAVEAIKKVVDQSAKHTLTIFRQHVQNVLPDDWYLECMDSILSFSVRYPYYIRGFTGSEAARVMYQSETNPYINYIPSLDVNIDAEMGDTMPDGWTIGATAAYWEAMTGSQGTLGCVSVNTGETTNLYLTRLYGIEKGINEFTIDIKDKGANDLVYVEFTYHYGDKFTTLSTTEINLSFASTGAWVTYSSDVTFPYNTSYVDIQVWSATAESYVDEITLRKKY